MSRRRLEVEDIGDVAVVNFVDKKILDEQNIQMIGDDLFRLVDELGRRKVLLNFKNVEFMSSAALGKLITLHRKLQAVQGKLAQLQVKRRFTEDKVVADVQMAYAALASAYEQAFQARQTVRYAEDLAQRERRGFDLGASDLLRVTLREQYAAESAEKEVYALLLYHQARADLRAAIALDRLSAPPSR